ncbi:extracellular solute-binding protein family 3 [Parafrankia sp. EAN1pec]|nr:extracellular solute-binding protein family 3 [Frankia sp. EAN1pec]
MRRVGRGPGHRSRRITSRITLRTTFRAMIFAAVPLLGTTAACGTVTSALPAAGDPLPAAVTRQSPLPARSTASPGCGDRTASLRPPVTLPPPGQPDGPTLRKIADRGYLTVGVRPDTPPFGSRNPDTGEFEGFDVDLALLVGRALFGADGHVRFRAVTGADRVALVRDGTLDLVAATLTITCDRADEVDFSAPYYLTAKAVLVLEDAPYQGLADLGGRRVCAAAGTTSLQQVVDAPSRPIPIQLASPADCLVAMQAGTVEAIVNDEAVLVGMVEQDPETRIVGVGAFDVAMGIAVAKDAPDLTRFVNGVLEQAERDGTWTVIHRRWLDGVRQPPPAPVYRD